MSSSVAQKQPDISNYSKQDIATLIKRARLNRRFTQKELADLAGITVRAVQRIENALVMPRAYTLNALLEQLDISLADVPQQASPLEVKPAVSKSPKTTQWILTLGSPILLFIGSYAFILQSPTFPENAFELCVLIFCIGLFYLLLLLKIWK